MMRADLDLAFIMSLFELGLHHTKREDRLEISASDLEVFGSRQILHHASHLGSELGTTLQLQLQDHIVLPVFTQVTKHQQAFAELDTVEVCEIVLLLQVVEELHSTVHDCIDLLVSELLLILSARSCM